MKERFIALCSRIGAQGSPEHEFEKLASIYSQPQRFYHNMNHIENCLAEMDSARQLVQQPNLLEFAIWYHDAIYDTRSKDNEERSAQLAYNVCLVYQRPKIFGEKVKELIMATKHTAVPSGIDAKILADIDLSILGASSQEYAEYEKNIRKEYSWVAEDKFKEGRSAILKKFLGRNAIYSTDLFRNRYEVRARLNLQQAISGLK